MPWTLRDGPGRPIWELFPPSQGEHIMEAYEERAAIMEYQGGLARHTAELFAYALTVDALEEATAIPARILGQATEDVLRQIDRAKRIRRHWVFCYGVRFIGALCRFGVGKLR